MPSVDSPHFHKDQEKWCVAARSSGCGIQPTKPDICRAYECFWLQSQKVPGEEMPLRMRPDHCGVIFEAVQGSALMIARARGGNEKAFSRPEVVRLINHFINMSLGVMKVAGKLGTKHGKIEVISEPEKEP